jgi:peptidoglycan/LPS O-acetylase OafA/YrhL
MTATTSQRAGRIAQLDFLRGIAILLVLFMHTLIQPESAGIFRPVSAALVHFGWSGVDLFFVLSGFLVGGLLLKEIRLRGSLDVKRFLIRRGLKIWPGYFALLLFAFAIEVRHTGTHATIRKILPNLLHLQNYLGTIRGHTWSLAVEEHFYLLLPLLLIFLLATGRKTISALPVIAAVVAVICLSLRILVVTANPHGDWHMGETHLRLDGLLFGVALAYAHHFHADKFARFSSHRVLLSLGGLALLLPMFWFDSSSAFVCTIGYTLLFLGYGLLLSVIVHIPLGSGILGRIMASRIGQGVAFIGFYSYSIYLWFLDLAQDPLHHLLAHHFTRVSHSLLWLAGMSAYIALAVLVGVVMAKLIELPGLALRDRLFPARAVAPASVDPKETPLNSPTNAAVATSA